MSSAKVKKKCEQSAGLNPKGGVTEAQAGALLAEQIANDLEAPSDLRQLAVHYRDELQAGPTKEEAQRREHFLNEWRATAAIWAPQV
jgi:hypothetical protein